jgi:hypothetical protein
MVHVHGPCTPVGGCEEDTYPLNSQPDDFPLNTTAYLYKGLGECTKTVDDAVSLRYSISLPPPHPTRFFFIPNSMIDEGGDLIQVGIPLACR